MGNAQSYVYGDVYGAYQHIGACEHIEIWEVIRSGYTDQNVPLREKNCTTKGEQHYPNPSNVVGVLGTLTINDV